MSYLEQLEAMHQEMIGALLGLTRGAEVAEPVAPVVVVATPAMCTACGKRPIHVKKRGLCNACDVKRYYKPAGRKTTSPQPPLPARLCSGCGKPLWAGNVRGVCRSCWPAMQRDQVKSPVEQRGQDATPRAIAQGDKVRIVVAKYDHPFAKGDVGRVVEITRQEKMTWYKLSAGGFWHNFPERDLELVVA